MKNVAEGKQRLIPVHVKYIKEGAHRLVVDPEHTVVKLLRVGRIVVECGAQLGRPAGRVSLRVTAFPPQMSPRILHQEKAFTLKMEQRDLM